MFIKYQLSKFVFGLVILFSCISCFRPPNTGYIDCIDVKEDSEIILLNADLDVKDAKSDIYFKMKKVYFTPFIGMSVKQDKHCTKTNYSVTKLFSSEDRKLCKEIKLDYLKECIRVTSGDDSKMKKEKREKINSKFYERL